jgi:hypothetical protein
VPKKPVCSCGVEVGAGVEVGSVVGAKVGEGVGFEDGVKYGEGFIDGEEEAGGLTVTTTFPESKYDGAVNKGI